MKIATNPVQSSQIKAVGHDPQTNTLAIEFTKGGGTYHYSNFTESDYAELMGTDRPKEKHSIGSHFYRHIKPFPSRFPFTRQPAAPETKE